MTPVYEPIWDLDCVECAAQPVVGIRETEDGALRCTGRCGGCFFGARAMRDPEEWNTRPEATE
jgi:hypothetical protein